EFPELAHPARDRGVLSLDQCFPDHLVSKRAVVSELLLELARALRGERFARRFAGRRRDLRSEVAVPTILWTPRGEEEETAQHEQHGPDQYCDGERRRHIGRDRRSEEHTSELQSRGHLVCRLLLEKKKQIDRMTDGRLA